jgi:hypothetical protein
VKQALVALAVLAFLAAPAQASLESEIAAASGAGDFYLVKMLAESGANLNVKDEEGYTPLMWAAQHGNTRVAAYLIEHGANLNPMDRGGYTPLMWAAQEGHFSTVALLLERGANPFVRGPHGRTAFDLAAYGRDGRIRELLYKALSGTPTARSVTPKPVSLQPVGTATTAPAMNAMAGGREPDLAARILALKKLAEAGGRASQAVDSYVRSSASNPMALMDPDVLLAKEIGTMYAELARDQQLLNFRKNLDKVKGMWNGRQESRFTSYVTEADQILKEAGV